LKEQSAIRSRIKEMQNNKEHCYPIHTNKFFAIVLAMWDFDISFDETTRITHDKENTNARIIQKTYKNKEKL